MILFWPLAVALIASALFTITQKSPVYSVVGLLANFLVLAALYFSLNAEFLGVIQIVVYSGAILMLFVFVIALLSSGVGPFSEGPNRLPHVAVPAILVAFAGFCAVAYAIVRGPLSQVTLAAHPPGSELGDVGLPNVFGSVGDFGTALFTVHLLPFEVTAFILMVAVVGVVAIAGDAAPAPDRGRHATGRRPAREREKIVKAKAL